MRLKLANHSAETDVDIVRGGTRYDQGRDVNGEIYRKLAECRVR